MKRILIEACCGSADDVFEAAAAGVDRVELNSAMFLGGLTPSIGEVRVALKAGVPVMAMIRPRQGGFCYTEREYDTMLADALALLDEGVQGIVCGVLHGDGTVDEGRCAPLAALAKERGACAVFHRAIDVAPDWRAAIDLLVKMGFDRVLTSGQQASVRDGADTVRCMREYAKGRIEILPGAGITPHNAERVLEECGCDQMHVLIEKLMPDSSTTHRADIFFGGALYPPEATFGIADRAKLAHLIATIREA